MRKKTPNMEIPTIVGKLVAISVFDGELHTLHGELVASFPTSPCERVELVGKNFLFDEPILVGKLATSLRILHGEKSVSNKIERCKVCNELNSLRRCDHVSQRKFPLDSAALYSITWSPKKHLKTCKRKT
jgi:hypothetical protein